MKRIICILMMLLFAFPALTEGAPLAEKNPFAPYEIALPEGVTLEAHEGTHAFASGKTRVVAMLIERVPDADPAEAIVRLMGQFEPDAKIEEKLVLENGCVGLTACTTDKFGEGVHQWNVMILSTQGDLLILSGYDLDGYDEDVHELLDALLAEITLNGADVVIK